MISVQEYLKTVADLIASSLPANSAEDLMSRMLEKLADHERMGIGAIWLIEPRKQIPLSQGSAHKGTVFEFLQRSVR